MSPILFWLFSALMLGFGAATLINRNPVACALSLVVSFLGLAALFIGLNAYFIGVIQVLVYAGAVMVLFLFIIMLLDLKAEQRRQIRLPAVVGGVVIAGLFAAQVVQVVKHYPEGNQPFPALKPDFQDAFQIGTTLFSNYNLPFQVIGVLILVASVGVVVLSKRELK